MNESAPERGGGLISFSTVRLRLDIAYDGTRYLGWAIQPQGRTIQGEIQQALGLILGTPCSLIVAGRTDAGVHARGQVAHVDIDASLWADNSHRLLRRLNGVLSNDIRVMSIKPAPPGFDARFSALARHYVYRIAISQAGPDPLLRHDRIHRRRALDVVAMKAGAIQLLGEHDFLAFCKPREFATTIRTLLSCDVIEVEYGVELHISADAFCHSMVRAIAGALLDIGEGRQQPEWIAELLDVTAKPNDVVVLAAQGLTLERVDYPEDSRLAAQAVLTRVRRGSDSG
jgi:tRNA pseudouridine38-40 synthase